MDWLDLLAVQGTLKSLLQHHSSKASILRHSAFFIVQLSHSCMTTGKTTALTRWTFVGKVMSLLFNMLSRLAIAFLPRNTLPLISWLKSPFGVILEPSKIKSVTVSPSICHEVMGPDATILALSLENVYPLRNPDCSTVWQVIWPQSTVAFLDKGWNKRRGLTSSLWNLWIQLTPLWIL